MRCPSHSSEGSKNNAKITGRDSGKLPGKTTICTLKRKKMIIGYKYLRSKSIESEKRISRKVTNILNFLYKKKQWPK